MPKVTYETSDRVAGFSFQSITVDRKPAGFQVRLRRWISKRWSPRSANVGKRAISNKYEFLEQIEVVVMDLTKRSKQLTVCMLAQSRFSTRNC